VTATLAAMLVAVVGVVGARIAHELRAAMLRRVVATALLCVGLLIAAQTVWGHRSAMPPGPEPPILRARFWSGLHLPSGVRRSSFPGWSCRCGEDEAAWPLRTGSPADLAPPMGRVVCGEV
jgi:hypothetical protein